MLTSAIRIKVIQIRAFSVCGLLDPAQRSGVAMRANKKWRNSHLIVRATPTEGGLQKSVDYRVKHLRLVRGNVMIDSGVAVLISTLGGKNPKSNLRTFDVLEP